MNRANSSSSMEAISELPGNVPGTRGPSPQMSDMNRKMASASGPEPSDTVIMEVRWLSISGGNQLALDGEHAGIFQLTKLLE